MISDSDRLVRAGWVCVLGLLFLLSGCNRSNSNNDGSHVYTPLDGYVRSQTSPSPTPTVTHVVTASAGANGSIGPATATVAEGSTTSFTVAPDAGYLPSVSGCGGTLAGSTYTTGVVSADCTITATFTQIELTLTPQAIKNFRFSWPAVAGATGYRLLEDPDSVSGYTEIANLSSATTSYDVEVSLPKRINARYVLEACNSQGCANSVAASVSTSLAEAAGYLKASNTGAGDAFGYYAVALSSDGNTLAVGAYQEDSNATGIDGNQADNSAANSGAVYVFILSGGTWSQQAYVKASNTQGSDYFGYALSLSSDGNTLAVGAKWEDSDATGVGGDDTNNLASASGAAYIFSRSGGTWSQQAYVKASNTQLVDQFGQALALSSDGNTLAVGASREASAATGVGGDQSDNTASNSGAVYVFTRSGGTWSQRAYVKAPNTEMGDTFGGYGLGLSSDGNTLAVGAWQEDSAATGVGGDQSDNSVSGSGAVYLY